MAKDNANDSSSSNFNNNNNLLSATPSTSSSSTSFSIANNALKRTFNAGAMMNSSSGSSGSNSGSSNKPYDANNSFVKKVATKVSDFIPQKSWLGKWFNNSQDEADLQVTQVDAPEYGTYEDKQSQPPPMKRPCIRMDVVHPPGTFSIQPRNRNKPNDVEYNKEHMSNHNDTTQGFLEPRTSGPRLDRFVSSTPAYPMDTNKVGRTAFNMMMASEQTNNNGATNGVDDNSESSESTSGCSSLIPQNNRQDAPVNTNFSSPFNSKRSRYEKFDFTNHLQSSRSLFLESNNRETIGSRQPSFNHTLINSTLGRSSSLISPFYSGNTMYGGANAANLYKSSGVLGDVSQIQLTAPKRASVEVNPSKNSSTMDTTGMSQTAKRILETLENFSSPLSDAKKIPIRDVMGTSSINASTASTSFSRKRGREDETPSPRVGLRHLTRELTVPTVPDILRIRRQQKLQRSTVNARKIANARNAINASVAVPKPQPQPQEYQIRTEEKAESKRNSQLKASKKMNLEEEETVEALNLPTMPLPISNLPRFDIALPQATKPALPIVPEKRPMQVANSDKNDSFKFASPIRLSDNAKTLETVNSNFTFSKPITPSKMGRSAANDSQELSKTLSLDPNETLTSVSSFPNFMYTGPSQTTLKPKEKTVEEEKVITSGPKVATELKTGSVMDYFKKQSSAAVTDSTDLWECSECLIKNSGKEKNCIACKKSRCDNSDNVEIIDCTNESSDDSDGIEIIECPVQETKPKPLSRKSTSSSFKSSTSNASSSPSFFGSFNSVKTQQSFPKTNLFNSASTKSADKSESTPTSISKPTSAPTLTTLTTLTVSATPQLTKPKAIWECPCCMVHNSETVTTCPCCNTVKPDSVQKVSPPSAVSTVTPVGSGFGDKFKKPEGSWTCDTCMVPNKSDATKCAACETPKPGAAKPTTTASAPAPPITGSGFGDMFKKPAGAWTCDTCMISNKSDVTKCQACETPKPGTSAAEPAKPSSNLQFKCDMPANAGSFKFGIDKADDSAKSTLANLPKANGFSFGNSATTSPKPAATGFNFGSPNADKSKAAPTGFSFNASETITATATFQFGAKPVEAEPKKDESKPAATFSFGVPAKTEAKPASTGFLFGATPAADSKPEEKSENKPVTAGFSFGAPAQPNKVSTDAASKPATEAAAPASNFIFNTPKPMFSAGDAAKTDTNTSDTSKTAAVTAATTPSQSTFLTPNFSFGNAAASSSSNASPATPSLFFSGQAKASKAIPNSTPLPAFGSPAAPKASFSFGKTDEAQPPTENKTPAFGSQTNQTTPSLFGSINSAATAGAASESKPLLFGAPDNKIAPAFGAASTADKPPPPAYPSATPAFGATTANPAASAAAPPAFGSTTSVFGSGTTPNFGTGSSSGLFSTTKSSETTAPTPGLFTFGQSTQSTTPAATGVFNFSAGSNAPAPAAAAAAPSTEQKSLFTFGSSSTTTPGNGFGSTSGFGSTPAGAANATPSFSFNAPKPEASATPSFGAPAASTAPMFNAPAPAAQSTSTGGFNFGGTGVPNSFSFGSAASTSGGFNFNAPSSTPAAPVTFDPNAQPTFNFTAGSGAPTAFNATPSAQPVRKIKKAVRRMPRQ